jgi:uncharacterized lipoprotein YajG
MLTSGHETVVPYVDRTDRAFYFAKLIHHFQPKNITMKRLMIILSVLLFAAACNNESKPDGSREDQKTVAPPQDDSVPKTNEAVHSMESPDSSGKMQRKPYQKDDNNPDQ